MVGMETPRKVPVSDPTMVTDKRPDALRPSVQSHEEQYGDKSRQANPSVSVDIQDRWTAASHTARCTN